MTASGHGQRDCNALGRNDASTCHCEGRSPEAISVVVWMGVLHWLLAPCHALGSEQAPQLGSGSRMSLPRCARNDKKERLAMRVPRVIVRSTSDETISGHVLRSK